MTNALRSKSVNRVARTVTRVVTASALVVAAAVVGAAVSPDGGRTIQAAGELASGGEYHELTPTRILDSRTPALDVAPTGRKPMDDLGAVDVFNVPVVGEGGLPAFEDGDGDGADDNVLAVVVNITVIAPDQIGYLRAFGKGAPEGETSVVNFFPNTYVPNTAILRPGDDGEISIRLVSPINPGTAHVAIDISGWFSSSTYGERGARVKPVAPTRVYDSMLDQFGGTTVGAGAQIKVPIRGASGVDTPGTEIVPDDPNVVGVMVNITGVNAFAGSRPTFVAAIPERLPAGSKPTTSNLNLVTGQFRSNMSILPVGTDGSIHLYNLDGSVRLIVDVVGYLLAGQPENSREGRVVPLVAPFRAFDTRLPEFFAQPLSPAFAEDWSFESFVNDVKIGSESVGAQAGLLGNLTVTGVERQYPWATVNTYVTAFPTPANGGKAVPSVSNITISEGQTVPNMVLLKFGANTGDPDCQLAHCVRFYNLAGYVDYLLDVSAVILSD
jgi:hypothetical protein